MAHPPCAAGVGVCGGGGTPVPEPAAAAGCTGPVRADRQGRGAGGCKSRTRQTWRRALLVRRWLKAYRFLRAVLMTATDDQIIPGKPCRVRGAAPSGPTSGPCSRCARSWTWPTGCLLMSSGSWCFWPPSPACAGASWPHCGGAMSTQSRAYPVSHPPKYAGAGATYFSLTLNCQVSMETR